MIHCGSPNRTTAPLTFTAKNVQTHCKTIVDMLFASILQKPRDNHPAMVHIKDMQSTRNKFDKLVSGGSHSLQIVSDFDRTMSKLRHNGVLIPTCHGIFEMDPELTEDTKKRLKSLTEKYYPIEFDPTLPDVEKIPHMIDWWRLAHDVIIECGIHRKGLIKTVKDCGVVLRERVRDFTLLLHKHKIPVLIFSAGLGDVICLLLEFFNMYTDNVRVVSNFMRFNEDDVLVGFSEPIIHSFNKTAASIANGDYAEISSQRPCVLLLGDSTGDVHMADGATVDDPTGVSGTVLRIGFLNEAVEANLEKYMNIYDIVLTNDETFDVPLKIVECVLQCHQVVSDGRSDVPSGSGEH